MEQKFNKRYNYTPENLKKLESNEVFVFGSNTEGQHAGGAAAVAFESFGAVIGRAVGMQGQSYAIPTMTPDGVKVNRTDLLKSLINFVSYAEQNQDKVFYLTKIGTGIAGWSMREVRRIFWTAVDFVKPEEECSLPANLVIPYEFAQPESYWNHTGKYQEQYDRLWKELVPPEGNADTYHGEVLRICSRLYYDYYNNGLCNCYDVNTDYSDDDEDYEETTTEVNRYTSEQMEKLAEYIKLLKPEEADEFEHIMRNIYSIIECASFLNETNSLFKPCYEKDFEDMANKVIYVVMNSENCKI